MPTAKKAKLAPSALMQATPYQLTQGDMHIAYGEELGDKIWNAYQKETQGKQPVVLQLPKAKPVKKKGKRKGRKPEGSDLAFKRTLHGSHDSPITQKARGLRQLHKFTPYAGYDTLKSAMYKSLLPYKFYKFKDGLLAPPAFARPCPIRPRHGFVESRRVRSDAELLTVFQESIAADPNAEVMVMEQLTGNFSAVITNAGITYGIGHDGVTASGSVLWRLPTPPGLDALCFDGSTIKESAYMECVEDWGELCAVQLRDGPAPPAALLNYIPHADYKVTAILDATPYMADLLAWERVAKGLEPGTLVLAPGCALSSHVVVHCIAHKIAVITERDVWFNVGDVVQPEASTPPALTPADFKKMASLMGSLFEWHYMAVNEKAKHRAFKSDWPLLSLLERNSDKNDSFKTHIQCLSTSLGTLHSMGVWGNSPHELRLRAFGVVTMTKFLAAACLGEARHFYAYGPGRDGATAEVPWNRLLDQFGISKSSMRDHRDYVYQAALAMGHKQLGETISQTVADFSGKWCRMDDDDWRDYRCHGNKDKGCSYGGPKWHHSAKLTRDLYDALTAFMAHPAQAEWANVVSYYNIAVNAMHNGGPLLSKWIETRLFDNACAVPALFFANGVAMRVICSDGMPPAISKQMLEAPNDRTPEEWRIARVLVTFSNSWTSAQNAFSGSGMGSELKEWMVPKLFAKWKAQTNNWGNGFKVYSTHLALWGKKADPEVM